MRLLIFLLLVFSAVYAFDATSHSELLWHTAMILIALGIALPFWVGIILFRVTSEKIYLALGVLAVIAILGITFLHLSCDAEPLVIGVQAVMNGFLACFFILFWKSFFGFLARVVNAEMSKISGAREKDKKT